MEGVSGPLEQFKITITALAEWCDTELSIIKEDSIIHEHILHL